MIITITERAASEIKRVMNEESMNETIGSLLRVAVAGGGCSGFQYNLTFDSESDAVKDNVFEQHGITVVVDKKSALYLDGTIVDYYTGLDKRGFTFENPNATRSCGCGSSFSA